jgi:hypothetical protein
MNRRPDGTRLDTADLARIALGAGLIDQIGLANLTAEAHNANLLRGRLSVLTARTRFEMWSDGLLVLDTRTEATSG